MRIFKPGMIFKDNVKLMYHVLDYVQEVSYKATFKNKVSESKQTYLSLVSLETGREFYVDSSVIEGYLDRKEWEMQ